MIQAIGFVGFAIVLCGLTVLSILGMTTLRMKGADALARDGLARGAAAPAWSLTDSAGRELRSPPAAGLQMIVFTDHSVKTFPSVVDGLRNLIDGSEPLETVVLLRRPNKLAVSVLSKLGLGEIPVVTGSAALYGRYNVRVTPFAIFVDSDGKARASSLLNHDWQIEKLLRLARVPVAADERPIKARRRLTRMGSVRQ